MSSDVTSLSTLNKHPYYDRVAQTGLIPTFVAMLRRTGQRRFAVAMIGTTVALSLFLLLSYDPLGLQIVECRDEACRATIPPQFLINRRTSGYVFRNESVATTSQGRARRFVVVFDAGSTGTRVHCFDFARARSGDDGKEAKGREKLKIRS